ncbi:MAG: hypothetical protein ACFE8U_17255, partial [Candidatus Hermodarchaeota archaeon]
HSNDTANELLSCGLTGIGVKLLVKKNDQDGTLVEMGKTKIKIPIHLSKVLCVKTDVNEN